MIGERQHIDAPIVVGVNGSPVSLAALHWSAAEAELTGRTVHAVAVWSYAPALEPGGTMLPARDIAAAHLRRLEEAVGQAAVRHPGARIEARLVEGDVVEALLAAARHAALLVLGGHRHGPLLSALLGSVSARCLRRARCPVVVVPGHATPGEATGEFARTSYVPGPVI